MFGVTLVQDYVFIIAIIYLGREIWAGEEEATWSSFHEKIVSPQNKVLLVEGNIATLCIYLFFLHF